MGKNENILDFVIFNKVFIVKKKNLDRKVNN